MSTGVLEQERELALQMAKQKCDAIKADLERGSFRDAMGSVDRLQSDIAFLEAHE